MANPSSSEGGAPPGATADTERQTRSTGQRASSRWTGAGDPFALLGLPAAYEIDAAALERAYFERSKALHPDRLADQLAGAPAAQRVAALSRSRALNDAYQLLKKPVSRAEYLLERAGVTIGDNERLDPAFLMEVLELREELAGARAAGNTDLVTRLSRVMQARRSQALDALPALFAAGDHAAIKERLIVLRYIHRYLEECDAALDEEAE